MASQERLWTKKEIAELLQVHEITVHRYIQTGKLVAVKPAGIVRVRQSDLDRFIAAKQGGK